MSQTKNTASILRCEKLTEKKIEQFVEHYKSMNTLMNNFYPNYKRYVEDGRKADDQFALFMTALDDFHPYIACYISIRTGDWKLRIASIKMMATRFVLSGAVNYKWWVMRHLADVKTYPKGIKDRLEAGSWVSCLKDGKGKCLARDEYHERTASKDIKFEMPKQLTKNNMDVLTIFCTYGATGRRSFTK